MGSRRLSSMSSSGISATSRSRHRPRPPTDVGFHAGDLGLPRLLASGQRSWRGQPADERAASTALKSATERLELRERQQSIIAQLGLLALKGADIQGFFDRVVGDVQRALDADFAKILELQPRQDELLLRAGVGWEEGKVGVAVEASGAGSPAGYALQSQAPVVIEDVAAERRFPIPALLEAHGVVSGISCAVRDGDHRYGVLGAYTKSRRSFTTEDEHFLLAVANVVGSAIGRHQNRMRLALELAVAQVLADANDELDETLGVLLERMARTMDSVLVAELWWSKGDKLTRRQLHVAPHIDRRRVERDFGPAFRAPGEGVVGRVFEELHALWIAGLENADVFMRTEGARALGLSSKLALPISAGIERLGVITLFSGERLLASLAGTGMMPRGNSRPSPRPRRMRS